MLSAKQPLSLYKATDIFSGRIVFLAILKLHLFTFGLSDYSLYLFNLIPIVFTAFLITYKFNLVHTWREHLLALVCMFSCFPLVNVIQNPNPDVWLLFTFTWIIYLTSTKPTILSQAGICCLLVLSLYIKETAILFVALFVIICLTNKKQFSSYKLSLLFLFIGFALLALLYVIHTGNLWFKINQIQLSTYCNKCTHFFDGYSSKLKRLTVELFLNSIKEGFLTITFSTAVIFMKIAKKEEIKWLEHIYLIILGLVIFFPFSFSSYQPLCLESRHYLFLLPISVLILIDALKHHLLRTIIIQTVLCICTITLTDNKIIWLQNILILSLIISYHKQTKLFTSAFIFISFLLLAPPYFHSYLYANRTWYTQLKQICNQYKNYTIYTADHDNYAHIAYLNQFNQSEKINNLEQYSYKVFRQYYSTSAWSNNEKNILIINTAYTVRTKQFFTELKQFISQQKFSNKSTFNNFILVELNSHQQLIEMKKLVLNDELRNNSYCL